MKLNIFYLIYPKFLMIFIHLKLYGKIVSKAISLFSDIDDELLVIPVIIDMLRSTSA